MQRWTFPPPKSMRLSEAWPHLGTGQLVMTDDNAGSPCGEKIVGYVESIQNRSGRLLLLYRILQNGKKVISSRTNDFWGIINNSNSELTFLVDISQYQQNDESDRPPTRVNMSALFRGLLGSSTS